MCAHCEVSAALRCSLRCYWRETTTPAAINNCREDNDGGGHQLAGVDSSRIQTRIILCNFRQLSLADRHLSERERATSTCRSTVAVLPASIATQQ